MSWASESRKAEIVGAYGPRRGNRTVQSVPIPRRPTRPESTLQRTLASRALALWIPKTHPD
jgi:hypothetical protein